MSKSKAHYFVKTAVKSSAYFAQMCQGLQLSLQVVSDIRITASTPVGEIVPQLTYRKLKENVY